MPGRVFINREHAMVKATFVANTCESDVVDLRPFAGGNVHLPSAWDAAHLGFKIAPIKDGTYQKHYNKSGIRVEITCDTVGLSHEMPSESFADRWVRFWSQTSGTDVDQTATRVLSLDLKG